jgi:hypothetical protein
MATELDVLCAEVTNHKHQQNRNYEFADIFNSLETQIDDHQHELYSCHVSDRKCELTAQILNLTQLLIGLKTRLPIEWEYFQSHPNMLNENGNTDTDSYDSYDDLD